jgi:hypothetical protein
MLEPQVSHNAISDKFYPAGTEYFDNKAKKYELGVLLKYSKKI